MVQRYNIKDLDLTREEKKKNNKLMDNLFKLPFLKKLKNVKHIEIIICIIFISLLLLIYFYGFNSNVKTKTNETSSESNLSYTSSVEYAKEIEKKLVEVLTSLKGVTKASVMVSVENGTEIKIAESVEEETIISSDGESKNVTIVKNPIIVTENGESKPIILMEILPEIKGVVVVADGADDVNVKLNIYKLIQATINISSNNIQVFAGK